MIRFSLTTLHTTYGRKTTRRHETCKLAGHGVLLQAFLKKASVDSDNPDDSAMAQLVDGRALVFAGQFETVFYSSVQKINSHNDFAALGDTDKSFVWNFFATMIIQNAASFARRVVDPVLEFPNIFLGMAKIRFDLPCLERKALAERLLSAARQDCLDLSSMKLLRRYQHDIKMAADCGRIGLSFYIVLKTLRRVWRSDVRENERLNKLLKLFGQRAPNSSLDLVSSRIALKYNLGAVVASQEGLRTSKRWSQMKPLAGLVFDKITDHWYEGTKVMIDELRFSGGPATIPSWVPSKETVHDWERLLDPKFQTATGQTAKSSYHVIAAAINRKLFKYWTATETDRALVEPRFTAMACVEQILKTGKPHRLKDGSQVFILAETVNRSVRILPGTWQDHRVVFARPWKFWWAADFFLPKVQRMSGNGATMTVMAFPVCWRPTEVQNQGGRSSFPCMECFHPGVKNKQTPFVTITSWEAVSCPN